VTDALVTLLRVIAIPVFVLVVLPPSWWLAGRLQREESNPFFRLLVACGFALVGYISFVNITGRLVEHSIGPALCYLALSAAGSIWLFRNRRNEIAAASLWSTWRAWIGPVLVALVIGIPQWLVAVSTNYWDEAASSALHLTAPNQFAEGVFPPRHNALPDVSIKYHYGFTILSGTVRWLTDFSAGTSIDIASTGLWLFTFLFVYFWLRQLAFAKVVAGWGGVAVLLGGGLDWLYLRRTEAYSGVEKLPGNSALLHAYNPSLGWLRNLIEVGQVPSAHLRNADGSLSNLPWDIAAQFQQHAVALGLALTVFTLFLFVTWWKQDRLAVPLLIANVAAFSVLLLAHAVFGGVAAVTAGICLLASWIRRPSRMRFVRGLVFGIGVGVISLMHGGLLSRGEQYGASGDVLTLRDELGYSAGGLSGFLNWNVAGFGVPLLLAIVAGALYVRHRRIESTERRLLFVTLSVFALFSYVVPQVSFYTSDTIGVEQFTEISKFFFSARFAFAMLSVFGVAYALGRVHWSVTTLAMAAMVVTPLAFCFANSFSPGTPWRFYYSPYARGSIEEQAGKRLLALKRSPHDVYFDASADERVHGYIGELLIFGGSVFTMTPSRYERTGIGYRLSEAVVAKRLAQNSRMARLLPAAAEQASVDWYYSRPAQDLAFSPMIVRSRFARLVAEGYLVPRFEGGGRSLYSIDKPTADIDRGIERYWRPRVVSQMISDWDGDGKSDLVFHDYEQGTMVFGASVTPLPGVARGEFAQLSTEKSAGEPRQTWIAGRMRDTEFRLGRRIEDIVEQNSFWWSRLDAGSSTWQPEYARWYWDSDMPIAADFAHNGLAKQIAYRAGRSDWQLSSGETVIGPVLPRKDLPLPLAGRFLDGSQGDLGVWSPVTGMLVLRTMATGNETQLKWGGRAGDVLVPGDYTGDGYDQIAVWQRTNRTWYWRRAPDGVIGQATFGTETSVPLPWDYNHDGRLDLAYWEPAQGKIYVTFSGGRQVDLVLPVPPHSIPAFVQMY
jgi:hypothetical protein